MQLDILYLYFVTVPKGGSPAGFSNIPLLFHSNTPILITIGINIFSQYIIKYKKLQPIVLKNTDFFYGDKEMEQKLRRDLNMGMNLRRLRIEHGYSQESLCVELQRRGIDIGRSAYQKYEEGRLNVKISVLIALKRLYDCTYDDFFSGLVPEE